MTRNHTEGQNLFVRCSFAVEQEEKIKSTVTAFVKNCEKSSSKDGMPISIIN